MVDYNFTCTSCGGHNLIRQINTWEAHQVVYRPDHNLDIIDKWGNGEHNIITPTIEGYSCKDCGEWLCNDKKVVTTMAELRKWLEDSNKPDVSPLTKREIEAITIITNTYLDIINSSFKKVLEERIIKIIGLTPRDELFDCLSDFVEDEISEVLISLLEERIDIDDETRYLLGEARKVLGYDDV